jgi:RimJ/RimL family protein N-acetyltransferase
LFKQNVRGILHTMETIKLVKFEQEDFERFKSWINNADELLQFAGPIFSFPVSNEQLVKYINDKRRIAYKAVLAHSNEAIGHCELNFENQLPRLSRILIADKEQRNKGYGKLVVKEMLNSLFTELGYDSADLNVFDWNAGAIKCYERIGFAFNNGLEVEYVHKGKIWKTRNMVISKTRWQTGVDTECDPSGV